MIVGIYVAGVALFTVTFALTRLPESVRDVTNTARNALQSVTDRDLDEHEKESIAQQAGLKLLKYFGVVTVKGVVTVVAAVFPFWLADVLAIVPWSASVAFAVRLDVLGITTLVLVAAAFFWRHWPTSRT